MRISLAPMEGITNFIFRRVYLKHFGGVDMSYTPFITANQTHSFKRKEKLEISPFDKALIPQILSNDAEAFVWSAKNIADMGYKEINLNLGCPSPTVTSRGRGAGMLADKQKLRAFFDAVFAGNDLPQISVKTRVGTEDPSEAAQIAELYSEYPFSHIIVHPRLLKDLYKGSVRLDCFREFYERIPADKLVFNGDINTREDALAVTEEFPGIEEIMTGRGVLKDPFLPEKIKDGAAVDTDPGLTMEDCQHIDAKIGVRIVKTVFLCNRQQTEFWLYVTSDDKPFVTREFCGALGIPRVSFASAEHLERLTGVKVGATTILSSILPEAKDVHLVMDRGVAENEWFACTDGTATCFVKIKTADLLKKYIPSTGHNLSII